MATKTPPASAYLSSIPILQEKAATTIQALFRGRTVRNLESLKLKDPTCGICLEDFKAAERVTQFLCSWKHLAHPLCALSWALADVRSSCPHDRQENANPYNVQKIGENPALLGRALIIASKDSEILPVFLERFTENPNFQQISAAHLGAALAEASEDKKTLLLFLERFKNNLKLSHVSKDQLEKAWLGVSEAEDDNVVTRFFYALSAHPHTWDCVNNTLFDLETGNLRLGPLLKTFKKWHWYLNDILYVGILGEALVESSKDEGTLKQLLDLIPSPLFEEIRKNPLERALLQASEKKETMRLFIQDPNISTFSIFKISTPVLEKALSKASEDREILDLFLNQISQNPNLERISTPVLEKALNKASEEIEYIHPSFRESFRKTLTRFLNRFKSNPRLKEVSTSCLEKALITASQNIETQGLFLRSFAGNPNLQAISSEALSLALKVHGPSDTEHRILFYETFAKNPNL